MPLIDYICKNCHASNERLYSLSDDYAQTVECSGCGEQANRKWETPFISRVEGAGMSPARTPGRVKR